MPQHFATLSISRTTSRSAPVRSCSASTTRRAARSQSCTEAPRSSSRIAAWSHGSWPPPAYARTREVVMSSHREAPEISKDPVADNTDTYAFISPDKPDYVTILANYIPLQDPAGGP